MKLPFLSVVAVILLGAATATSTSDSSTSTQTRIAVPAGTIVGSVLDGVEYYRGIPFAQSPTGSLRLKPPVRLEPFADDTIQATGVGPACPQSAASSSPPLLLEASSEPGVAAILSLGSSIQNETEDCLTISVMRPQGTAPDAKLPVMFWIYGGAFAKGSTQPYNASVLIPRAVAQDKPFIFVAVNYRLGGFGFLAGREVLADGSANLGLLDQRMGLEWVADNIAAFGGDPAAVTVSGESAGAISTFHQLALYNGNNSYNGNPLFRAAIMNSGSVLTSEPVDGDRAQAVFDTVVEAAGCSSPANVTADPLACLRDVDYATYLNVTNSVSNGLSSSSIALSYPPRPDGSILTASTDVLAKRGKYAAVPLIIGDNENEGTLFSLSQSNITTKAALVTYLREIIFHHATQEQVTALVDTYPHDYHNGSVATYPEFQRLAAILGDINFTLMRRVFLQTVPASVPAWSWIATWNRGTPILGTFHTTDVPRLFYDDDATSLAMQDRYIAFVNSLDPNDGAALAPVGYQTYWPTWRDTNSTKGQLLEFGVNSTGLVDDCFREASFEYIESHLDVLRY
ncbi:putative secreted lipase [Lachnellula arida]|uniref:Carboxylic ester hydrolase n=1 Tax=Lachnellula arida TaxID=1316785 RepID=A0A8T9BLW2_9HELO|nr:putative secreted lipase [Lachnellula arida]